MSAENLITQHLDTWTQAIETKSTAGRGSSNKLNLVGIQKLRELILEMAVRGLLVPQDSNDEPANVLLEKIAAEKAQLIKDGKIKKTKALPEISEDEKPFELPNGWEWARLPEVCFYNVGKTPATKNSAYWTESSDGLPWVSIADLNHDSTVNTTTKKITSEAVEKVFKSVPAPKGSILMSFKLTVGKVSFIEMDAYHNEAIISINCYEGVNNKFLFKVLPERANSGNSKRAIMGYTLNSSSLAALLIPVPPSDEQKRIVVKVDELMALCDQLESQTLDSIATHQTLVETLLGNLVNPENTANFDQAWSLIAQNFDVLFTTEHSIDTLKQTILQLAVMGKLVPQNPNDEPASELLKKITAEKALLIKDGKIKKSKPLPAITEDEKPFDLPNGWEWVRLGEVCVIRGGKRVSNGYKLLKEPTPYIYIRVSDMKNGTIDDSDLHYIDLSMREKISQYIITQDDLYMTIVGATIGKCGSVPPKFHQMNLTENAARLSPLFKPSKSIVLKILESEFCQNQFFDKTKQVGVQKMALARLASTLIPFPSTEEQTRIVTKINELMVICDQVKTQIQAAQQTQIHLAQSIAQETLQ